MSGNIDLSDDARADLADIWAKIAKDSPRAADKLIDRLEAGCARLADHPRSGVARPEVDDDARSVTVGNYILFYRVSPSGVEIVRVLHGARNLPVAFHERSSFSR